jgi:hypothetical protein
MTKAEENSVTNPGHIAFCEGLARRYIKEVADALADGIIAEMKLSFLTVRAGAIDRLERLEALERAVETLRGDFAAFRADVEKALAGEPLDPESLLWIRLRDIANRTAP